MRFFKTGPGEYGEGDKFLGLSLPAIRAAARTYKDLPLATTIALLRSPWHEERLLALIILVKQYERGTDAQRGAIHRAYLANTRYINNWDLVDSSAQYIVGPHLKGAKRLLLARLARSRSMWERRIAVLATFAYIKDDDFADALRIAELLLGDEHDLIHKATGWMLREVGKRDERVLESFLRRHVKRMPRTTLRYAIERFSPRKRAAYMEM